MEAKPEYETMVVTKYYCAMRLMGLMKKMCDSSTFVVVDNVVNNLLEAMCNSLLIHGDNFPSLLKCLDASEHQCKVLKEAGFDVANSRF